MALGKDEFLTKPTRSRVSLASVEGLGDVYIAELSTRERLELVGLQEQQGEAATLAKLAEFAVGALADQEGARLFANGSRGQAIEALMEHPPAVLINLVKAVAKAQGMDADAVKDAVGNSERGPSDASSSS